MKNDDIHIRKVENGYVGDYSTDLLPTTRIFKTFAELMYYLAIYFDEKIEEVKKIEKPI
jgi:hypothetical protein